MKIKSLSLLTALLAAMTIVSCDKINLGEAPEDESQFPNMTLEGKEGDDSKANMVYVDLSEGVQHKVARTSWHLGFYCKDQNRVTLNQSLSRAYSTGKTDFAAVTLADTLDMPDLSAGMMAFLDLQKIKIADDVDRDLNKTLLGEIGSDPSKTLVYFLATEGMKRSDWFKIKVTMVDNAYEIQYGRITDTRPTVATIKKDATKTILGFSLETGKTVSLPEKWDFMWSYAMAWSQLKMLIFGPASDVIATNRYHQVQTAVVEVAQYGNFEDFGKENLSKLKFEEAADVIGTKWRTAPMPGSSAGPNMDIFYVIKDEEGNYFKVRFTHFCEADGGVRGLPTFDYVRLQ